MAIEITQMQDKTIPPQSNGRSILCSMAEKYGMEPKNFEATLRTTVIPEKCTREQFAAFVLVAHQYNLNPITREIYAFPTKAGWIQPVVGVDGWYKMVNNHPAFDGVECIEEFDDTGRLHAVKCSIWRNDRSRPIVVREYLKECIRNSDMWRQWPTRMLRHKAYIQAARMAFGFCGIVDPDEFERFDTTMPQANPEPKGPLERLKAAIPEFTSPLIPAADVDDYTEFSDNEEALHE